MDGPKSVSVRFGRMVELSLTCLNGSLEREPSALAYIPGNEEIVRLIAIPDSGFKFHKWEGDSLIRISADTAWVCMNASRSVTAIFVSDKALFTARSL